MTTNNYGFDCEEMIRDLLPQIGIPHKNSRGVSRDWFWWASKREDHCLGIDCWVTLNLQEFPVDFTVISGEDQMEEKAVKALGRGVIPVFIPQRMLREANEGCERALANLGLEIKTQICLKKKLLKGNIMTRELAEIAKEVMCPKVLVQPRVRVAYY